jgi:thiamine biosynthesis protein ThiS
MKVTVNDDSVEISDGATLDVLIEKLELQACKLAIAANNQVIAKEQRSLFVLNENDHVIIIRAVSGG